MSIDWPAGTAAALLHTLLCGEHPECACVLAEITVDVDAPLGRAAAQLVVGADVRLRGDSASPRSWHRLNELRPAGLSLDHWRPLIGAARALDAELRAYGPPRTELLADARHPDWSAAPSAVRIFHTVAPNDRRYFARAVAPLLEIDQTSLSSSDTPLGDQTSLSSIAMLSSLDSSST